MATLSTIPHQSFETIFGTNSTLPNIMAFKSGDTIEVQSKEEGFNGSYYEATVVTTIPRENLYVVEYKRLVEDDTFSSKPLREVVEADEVRPRPPVLPQHERWPVIQYCKGDRVDAFDNDGWWVGTITGMDANNVGNYYVYFELFNVEIAYHVRRLRVHQEWNVRKGNWSKNV